MYEQTDIPTAGVEIGNIFSLTRNLLECVCVCFEE